MGGRLCDNSSMLRERILGHLKICAAHHMHCDLFLEAVISKSQPCFVRLKNPRFNDKQAPSASSSTHQTWRDDIRAALKIKLCIMIILTKTAKKKKKNLICQRTDADTEQMKVPAALDSPSSFYTAKV